ncbi:hypothetical protein BTN50_0328 [Candidatus Enterovibrio altilux]|uniref:Uncharacterized protein n=1 Tax=Candidatus Enterovibrio altilux TaxID=1927128 RepID=A0A291B781_9GAMM|nr:hypothetical protein BTN50_0328 [Candidatus Enterovibrio luxaltus]
MKNIKAGVSYMVSRSTGKQSMIMIKYSSLETAMLRIKKLH